MNDRRRGLRDRRRALRAPLVVAVAKRSEGRWHLAQSADIGTDGLGLRYLGGEVAYLPRTEVDIELQLPGSPSTLRLQAEVVFDRAAGEYRSVGLRFGALPADAQARIEAFVAA